MILAPVHHSVRFRHIRVQLSFSLERNELYTPDAQAPRPADTVGAGRRPCLPAARRPPRDVTRRHRPSCDAIIAAARVVCALRRKIVGSVANQ
ncbi:hypothetical protein EVAR_91836_1 [Eumeta japonica]|uniref:Uncharacterized protein n=1 Tax=Eumeta variegata TaxID=151549 RepID=A0A4C2A773_EUMVA|nr:hypothetical protein EVAR_91836_1 [Eumeta japonica]